MCSVGDFPSKRNVFPKGNRGNGLCVLKPYSPSYSQSPLDSTRAAALSEFPTDGKADPRMLGFGERFQKRIRLMRKYGRSDWRFMIRSNAASASVGRLCHPWAHPAEPMAENVSCFAQCGLKSALEFGHSMRNEFRATDGALHSEVENMMAMRIGYLVMTPLSCRNFIVSFASVLISFSVFPPMHST